MAGLMQKQVEEMPNQEPEEDKQERGRGFFFFFGCGVGVGGCGLFLNNDRSDPFKEGKGSFASPKRDSTRWISIAGRKCAGSEPVE